MSLSLAFLAACRSAPVPPSSTPAPVANAGRYAIEQDRAPSRPLDPSQIREVVPVPVNRTMAGNRSPYTVNGRTYRVMATEEGFQQTGLASWYGEKFHGFRTSNGEVFDMYQVSAAHVSLPIPSFVRVTNLENQR
ncbi:MAG TPA: RlpA-like double-psi beta-barrel domain-containing protein, partial [Pseudohongiella sp.]|nr:RlpA-like double-psi beta-barrel domain-containing protein [Pseudohongiella sp.]